MMLERPLSVVTFGVAVGMTIAGSDNHGHNLKIIGISMAATAFAVTVVAMGCCIHQFGPIQGREDGHYH